MSMGRERFFKATCHDHLWLAERKVYIFTVSMSIEVLAPSGWADVIKANINTANIKKVSYEVLFDFINTRTNDLIAKGCQKVAILQGGTERFSPIPDDIKNVIIDYIK
jgi:acyl-CoA thioesterase FadM